MPGGKQRLRIEITVNGASPQTKWGQFLDRWFDHFDVNDHGVLDQREADRIFPLPVPGNRSVPFDFAKADTNGDARITREELKAYYFRSGFTPVLAVAEPVSVQDRQLAEASFRHFGPDAAGKLRLDRFKQAASVLRKLDENEDEVLTPAEVLSIGIDPALNAPSQSEFAWHEAKKISADPGVRLTLGGAGKPALHLELAGKSLQRIPAASKDAIQRIRHEHAIFAFSISDHAPAKAVATSRQFVLAQFGSIAGKSKSVQRSQIQDDASLQLLADLFPHADRNQDGRLTLDELQQFLDLIDQGVNCLLLVRLSDRERNLFLHFDTNADGRLDLQELNSAHEQVVALGGASGWTRIDVPHYVQISLQRGFAASAFGPLPLAMPSSPGKAAAAVRSARGPAWFQAMDKNGDGFLSPREFLGPLEVFRQMDRNGDGLISIEEAEHAGAER